MKVEIRKVEKAEEEKAVIATRQMTGFGRRAATLLRMEEMTLVGTREDNNYEIPAHLVYYIEKLDLRTLIHTKNAVYDTEERIPEIAKRMDDDFLRCAKNRIVNVRKIRSVKHNGSHRLRATLLNDEVIDMDRNCLRDLKDILGI